MRAILDVRIIGGRGGLAAATHEVINDEIDHGISKNSHNKADNSVENGIFGTLDAVRIAIGCSVANTADDDHDDGDSTEGKEHNVDNAFDS